MIVNLDVTLLEANLALRDEGFHGKQFGDLELPDIRSTDAADGSRVYYSVYGNPNEARMLVFASAAYTTSQSDGQERVILSAQQAVLGSDYCLVGVQAYDPKHAKFDESQRYALSTGSFVPLADRTLTVIEKLKPRDDQQVALYGYSMGADVSVETSFQVLSNPERGLRQINKLGAFECARTIDRSSLEMFKTFSASGDELFDNILTSHSPALLEAQKVNSRHPSKLKHELRVTKHVLGYVFRDIPGNLALLRGFATDASLNQLDYISTHPDGPSTVVGRASKSEVCVTSFAETLERGNKINVVRWQGDHSSADKLQNSAAFILRTIRAV